MDGEWSFVETLRHLLFVHDAWLRRAVLGETDYDPLDLPHDEMPDLEGVPHDADARPALDHVLALREDRLAVARRFFDGLTDELLGSEVAVTGPGYPEAGSYRVPRCLHAVLDEEWWHRRFAERDLAVLEARVAERSEHHPLAGQVEGEPVGVEEIRSTSPSWTTWSPTASSGSRTSGASTTWPDIRRPANVRPRSSTSGRAATRVPTTLTPIPVSTRKRRSSPPSRTGTRTRCATRSRATVVMPARRSRAPRPTPWCC